MVLSQFNYADIVYMNMCKLTQYKIQKIQNMCIRFVYNYKKYNLVSISGLRKKLGWFSMSERRVSHGLILMFKIVNGMAPNYLSDLITFTSEIHSVNTRSSGRNLIWVQKDIKINARRHAFFYCMSNLYNKLPENIISSVTVNSFKCKLNKYIAEENLTLPDHFL